MEKKNLVQRQVFNHWGKKIFLLFKTSWKVKQFFGEQLQELLILHYLFLLCTKK